MRVLRSDMIATLQEDYIAMAKAKGLRPARILLVHALKPSSLTLVTVAGINIGRLIGGTVIVETIFALPGIGRLLVGAIYARDFIILQGVVLFVAVGLRARELRRRHALRRARSEDPPWPCLSSKPMPRLSRRFAGGVAWARCSSAPWPGSPWSGSRAAAGRRPADPEPDRHGHAGRAARRPAPSICWAPTSSAATCSPA